MPVADEVGRLQRKQDEECRLFQTIAEQGHYAGRTEPTNTRQGIYAAAPSGKLLASVNTRDPEEVAAMLERALEAWKELGRNERRGPVLDEDGPRRWEARYPEGGLVLRVVVRDVDVDAERRLPEDDWRAFAWNQDFAWFTSEEAATLVPERPEKGDEHAWPAELAQRLVRDHLVDFARGQVPVFAREDVELAEVAGRVVSASAKEIELELSGRTRARTGGRAQDASADRNAPAEQERGIETELVGRATYDRKQKRFTRFELVAIGKRWGGAQYNGRGDDLEGGAIGFSFTLAGDTPAERVAPASVWDYGWVPP